MIERPDSSSASIARNLEGYVGFANLPNQVYRKSVKRGFEFTLMVVGESGLGKSTLINSLFLTELYSKDYPGPSQRIKKTVQIMKEIQEHKIKIYEFPDSEDDEDSKVIRKIKIMKEIQEHKIKIYEFPDSEDDEDSKVIRKIKERMPLAVVGSNVVIEVNGKKVRGRQYPWGVAEVENGEHCDFTILRNMLIRTHMQDLKDVTNNVHYENYRSRKLAAVTCNGVDATKTKGQLTKSPLAQMEEERREHVTKMKKMETEMEQVFEMKVKEKKQKLKDSEAELERRHEQMKKNLEAQYKELEEKRKQYEEEKVSWEAQQRILEQQKLDASK
ncbi:UNVERIFIED_CONTAM: hypothetical protein FKN15_028914 [Acipenser sinensis]